jgi:tetratricopeptide (TPR) repeat protein
LEIWRAVLGEQHPSTAGSLEGLAMMYQAQSKYADAEALYQQALTIYHTVVGEVHPHTARCRYNLALLYRAQGNHEQALLLFEQAVVGWQTMFGDDHRDTRDAQDAVEQTRRALAKARRQKPIRLPGIFRKRAGHS